MIEALSVSPLVRAIALALVDFVWQGAAIGLATAFVLALSRRAGANARYRIACAGLAAMTLAPVLTAAGHLNTGSSVSAANAITSETAPLPATVATEAGSVLPVRRGAMFREWLEPRLPAVALLWSAGVLLMATHLFAGWIRVKRIRRSASVLEMSRWPARVRAMAGRFAATRRVRLLVSSVVDVPAVIGFLRPAILVPASALSGLTPAHLEAILLHELAHVRRGDYLVNVVQCVVEVLLFYHPAVWWVSSQIRREREHCCDDVAASLCADRMTYARALTSLEELRGPAPRLALGAAGGDLLARIRRLIDPERVSSPRVSGGFAMGIIVTIALLALGTQAGSLAVGADQAGTVVPPSRPVEAAQVVTATTPTSTTTSGTPAALPVRPTPTRPAEAAAPAMAIVGAAPPARVDQDQTSSARLSGTVRDRTGAVIPGVRIALSKYDPSVVTSASEPPLAAATSNARGEFALDGLTAGSYLLTISQAGFRTGRTSIALTAGQIRRIDVVLNVGSLTESVWVEAPGTAQRAEPSNPRAPHSNPQTVGTLLDDAKLLYEQGLYAAAARAMERARELVRATAQEASTITDAPTAAAQEAGPIRVGGSISEPKKIRHVSPKYPAEALAAGVEGLVVVEAVIATDGSVRDVEVTRSVAMLDGAAMDAVRQWLFTPTLLNGTPVEVIITASVNFAIR
jgi:TonB family protein